MTDQDGAGGTGEPGGAITMMVPGGADWSKGRGGVTGQQPEAEPGNPCTKVELETGRPEVNLSSTAEPPEEEPWG